MPSFKTAGTSATTSTPFSTVRPQFHVPLHARGTKISSRFIFAGVAVVFYLKIARLIFKSRRVDQPQRSDKWLLVLSTGLMVMITIYVIAQNFFGEEMWVINEGYPGGSGQYYADHAAVWYQTLGSASSVVLCLMSDAFLVRYPTVSVILMS